MPRGRERYREGGENKGAQRYCAPTSKDPFAAASVRVELGRGSYRHVLGGILDGDRSVRILSPLEQRQAVGSEEAADASGVQRRSFSSTGTRTLMALSLMTVRLATRVMNWLRDGDGKAVVMMTCIMTGRSELPFRPCEMNVVRG